MEMQKALDAFITTKTAAGLSPGTLDWYQWQIQAFTRWLTARGWDLNTWPGTIEIEAFLAEERQRLAPTSVAGRHRALRVFFGWLVERGYVVVDPMVKIKLKKLPKRQPRYASLQDFDRLLERMPVATWVDLRDRLAVQTLFLCGLRLAEVTHLVTSDFKTEAGLLLVRSGKGGDDRLVPLLPAVAKALVAYLWMRPAAETDRVFLSADGILGVRDVLTPNGLRQVLRRRCEAAGVPYLNPHSFRHGLAIHLLNNGGDMSLVQKILGHNQISTTAQFYAKWLTEGMVKAFADVMENPRR